MKVKGIVPPYKVVVGERPWENAEDDLWYDSLGRVPNIYDIVGRAFGEQKARELDDLVNRWVGIFARDQQAHMGVEFD